jgi:hypothetical protein
MTSGYKADDRVHLKTVDETHLSQAVNLTLSFGFIVRNEDHALSEFKRLGDRVLHTSGSFTVFNTDFCEQRNSN